MTIFNCTDNHTGDCVYGWCEEAEAPKRNRLQQFLADRRERKILASWSAHRQTDNEDW